MRKRGIFPELLSELRTVAIVQQSHSGLEILGGAIPGVEKSGLVVGCPFIGTKNPVAEGRGYNRCAVGGVFEFTPR